MWKPEEKPPAFPFSNRRRRGETERLVARTAMSLDASCAAAYTAVFSDDDPAAWCSLRHEGKKVVKNATGKGGLDELVATFKDDEILFCLLRMSKTDDGGDSKRIKFIYIVWCGNSHRMHIFHTLVHKVKCSSSVSSPPAA